jgi:hypothetical protein
MKNEPIPEVTPLNRMTRTENAQGLVPGNNDPIGLFNVHPVGMKLSLPVQVSISQRIPSTTVSMEK